jgi:hypothetical protein
MKHPQAVVVILIGLGVAFALLVWVGSLWGALGALICGLVLLFVLAMAWLWSPRSGIGRGREPTHDSFHGLR